MELPRLKSCCCGCSLRTGTLILLYFGLVCQIISIFLVAILYLYIQLNPHRFDSHFNILAEKFIVQEIGAVVVGLSLIIAGLYGVFKKKHDFLFPYLAISGISVVVGVIGTAVLVLITIGLNFAALFSTSISFNPILILASALVVLIVYINTYLWLVVYSHYRDIKENNASTTAFIALDKNDTV